MIGLLYQRFFELLPSGGKLHLAVLHGGALEETEELAACVQKEHAPEELIINLTGAVLGKHTGPGALALCGYREK